MLCRKMEVRSSSPLEDESFACCQGSARALFMSDSPPSIVVSRLQVILPRASSHQVSLCMPL